MAVVVETTLGDITVDLFLKERPKACQNFLKLCKLKYYNYNLFHTVSRGFIAQTGDPTGSRHGGESIFGVLEGPLKRFFLSETNPKIKHTVMGLISFVGNEENMVGSQFFFTLGDELTYLDDKHCVFGQVTEGLDVLEVINEAICDSDDRPYQDIRITHTVILDDPLPDLPRMVIPSRSPSPSAERLQGGRIAPDEEIDETAGKSLEEINEMAADREAKARATILEMVGDIPDIDVAPPENVLFVCKLNPVTTEDDLEIIFSRFGKIKSCEVIKDHKTGDSLQYAFVEFEEQKSCEDAYFKMDNVLIDDRRIHVDFSQSVSKVKWLGKGRGVKHFNDKDKEIKNSNKNRRNDRSRSRERNYNYKENRNDKRPSNRNYSRKDNQGSRRYENDRNRSNSYRNYYNERRDYRDKKDTRRNEERRRNRSRSTSPVEAKRHTSKYENSPKYQEKKSKRISNRDASDEERRRNRSRSSSPVEAKRNTSRYENSSKYQVKNSKRNSNRNASDSSSDRSTENKGRMGNRNSSKDRYKDKGEKRSDQRSRKRSRSIEKRASRKKRSSSSSDDEHRKIYKSSSPESPPRSKKKKRKEKSRSSSSDSCQEQKNKNGKSRKVEKSSKKSRKRSSSSDSSTDRKLDKHNYSHKKRN